MFVEGVRSVGGACLLGDFEADFWEELVDLFIIRPRKHLSQVGSAHCLGLRELFDEVRDSAGLAFAAGASDGLPATAAVATSTSITTGGRGVALLPESALADVPCVRLEYPESLARS